MTNPVRWQDIINYFECKGINLVIDFSAKNIFENINKDIKTIRTICYGVGGERELFHSLLQDEEYINNRTTFISKSILVAASTPNLNFNSEAYNTYVANNYQKLLEIGNGLANGSIIYSKEVKASILKLLKLIFDNKKVSADEQDRCIQQILEETASNYQQLI